MKSIIQEGKYCYKCGTLRNLEDHHIFFGTANRKKSEKYGLKVWLCMEHHRGNEGVHFDKRFNDLLKRVAQRRFEEEHSRELFMQEFGRNYLDC